MTRITPDGEISTEPTATPAFATAAIARLIWVARGNGKLEILVMRAV